MAIMNKILGLGVAALIVGRHWLRTLTRRLGRLFPQFSLGPATERSRGDVPGYNTDSTRQSGKVAESV